MAFLLNTVNVEQGTTFVYLNIFLKKEKIQTYRSHSLAGNYCSERNYVCTLGCVLARASILPPP